VPRRQRRWAALRQRDRPSGRSAESTRREWRRRAVPTPV